MLFNGLKLMHLKTLKDKLMNSTSLEALNKNLEDYFSAHNILHYSFTYYSYHPNSKNKLKYEHCSHQFQLWHDHYISENYEDIDSTLTLTYKKTMPIYWDVKQQLEQAKTERERKMRRDAIEYGAEKGLCIPIHGPNEDFATFLVVQMQGETCLNDWANLQFELLAAAHCYYHYLQNHLLNALEPYNKYHLSKREMQCLTLTAQRCTVPEIAEKLFITERTVNFHLQRVNKKLGVRNKHQAVLKALEKQILTP